MEKKNNIPSQVIQIINKSFLGEDNKFHNEKMNKIMTLRQFKIYEKEAKGDVYFNIKTLGGNEDM